LEEAARVESELLRALRLHCVPGADASVEAELWFSPLVNVRSPGVLVIDGEVVAELRRQVALHLKWHMGVAGARKRVERITEVIARVHADAPPLLRLEEEVIAGLVLGRDPAELDERLRSVLGAMAQQPSRRRALVHRWVPIRYATTTGYSPRTPGIAATVSHRAGFDAVFPGRRP
jgi:hypothetical protein